VSKKFLTLSFVFGVLLVAVAGAKEKPLKVFIFGGQSNMVGFGASVEELPPALRGAQQNVVVFDGAKWAPLVAGKTTGGQPGPEVSCAQKLSAELKEPIGIIKLAVSGSSLAGDWAIAKPRSLYGQLVTTVKAARQGREIEIVGMFWLQGERDARNGAMANAYAENFKNFIRKAREDFTSPKMFFVAGRVNPPKNPYAFVDTIRKAQEECKEENYAFVDCDSLAKRSDMVHYTTMGLVDLGHKFADQVLTLMGKTPGRSSRDNCGNPQGIMSAAAISRQPC